MNGSGIPTIVAGTGEFTAQMFADIPEEHRIRFRSGPLTTPADVAKTTAGADGVVVDYEVLATEHIAAMADTVKVIGYSGTGIDVLDVDAARARYISVIYMPGLTTHEVADHTVALMLGGLRRLKVADEVARDDWGDWRRVGSLRTLGDATVGLIGLGRIGHAVLARLAGFGSRVLVCDPALDAAPPGTTLIDAIDDLLAESDVVSLHLPLTAHTHKLIGAHELNIMKSHAVLVNASRGGLIDEQALVHALQSGEIGGAALDVVAQEPLATDAAILTAPNTLLTPHVGWYSQAAEARSRDQTLHAVADFIRGDPPRFGAFA